MRQLTVAERRERELNYAVKEYGIPYDTARNLMNRFYRLNGGLDRLSYLENDERTCNRASTKRLSESTDKRAKSLNADFNRFGLCLNYFGHLATICIKGTTRTAINAIYYERG